MSRQNRMQILEECMTKYGSEIKRVIFSYVRNHSDTDDITQEVFYTVYKNLNQFKGNAHLKTWIYRIAINKSKDHLRKANTQQKKLVELFNNHSSTTASVEELSLQSETSNELLKEIFNLPLIYREVIVLYYFEELNTQEIAHVLDENINTVEARLRRSRERLREMLETIGGEFYG